MSKLWEQWQSSYMWVLSGPYVFYLLVYETDWRKNPEISLKKWYYFWQFLFGWLSVIIWCNEKDHEISSLLVIRNNEYVKIFIPAENKICYLLQSSFLDGVTYKFVFRSLVSSLNLKVDCFGDRLHWISDPKVITANIMKYEDKCLFDTVLLVTMEGAILF